MLKRNDKFAKECNYVIEQNIDDQNKAKAIIKEIHRVISHSSFSPPRKISYLRFLHEIRLLRNFKSHHWTSNDLFKGMIDSGIDDFVISLMHNIFSKFSLSVVKPIKCLSTGEIVAIKYTDTINQILLPKLGSIVNHKHIYIFYYDDEPHFKFKCTLVRTSPENDRLYVYSNFQNKYAFFESIDVNGGLDTEKWGDENVANILGISLKSLVKYRRSNDAMLLPYYTYVKRKEVAPGPESV